LFSPCIAVKGRHKAVSCSGKIIRKQVPQIAELLNLFQ